MTDTTGSFIWYELMTTDAAEAARFYGAVVGWTVGENVTPEGEVDYRMIQRDDGGNAGGLLTLTDEMTGKGARPVWVGYIHVADVDAAVAAISADGGAVLMPANDLDVGRIAMVTDPQGAPFYVMTPTGPEGESSDAFSAQKPQHVRWNELATSDQDAAIAFYTGHFGWAQEGEMDMGPMGAYKFLTREGDMIGAVMRKPPEMPMSLWTYYIGVDDIDRASAAVRDNGGTVLVEPVEIPGGEFSLNGVDPQGALFGLVGPRKD